MYKNVQAQVDNQTKKAISVKIADGTTLKVESGESCTITPKERKKTLPEKTRRMEKTRKQTIPRTEMLLPAVLLRAILLVEQQLRHLQS